MVVRH